MKLAEEQISAMFSIIRKLASNLPFDNSEAGEFNVALMKLTPNEVKAIEMARS